jgi:hypothetical protein
MLESEAEECDDAKIVEIGFTANDIDDVVSGFYC